MCKDGQLIFRDYCRRILRQEGGDSEWIMIPRHRCNNPGCRKLHRIIPDILVPYKHYQEEVIVDSLDKRIDPACSDDRPSEQTVRHWNHWLMFNALNIDGHLKSIGHREQGFSEGLLRSGVSLLESLRRSIPERWLKVILRTIYNAGGRLVPFYP